jgi:hypothetical protein
MKIEIDLDKLRQDMILRQQTQTSDDGVTVEIRKWGELMHFHPSLPEEFAIEQMQRTIENRISTFMRYAPDISDINPNEIQIQQDFNGLKTVTGTFYYCSQIVDYWEKQKTDAVEHAKRTEHIDTLYRLKEIYEEQSEYGNKECWQKYAAEDIDSKLESLV